MQSGGRSTAAAGGVRTLGEALDLVAHGGGQLLFLVLGGLQVVDDRRLAAVVQAGGRGRPGRTPSPSPPGAGGGAFGSFIFGNRHPLAFPLLPLLVPIPTRVRPLAPCRLRRV